MKTPEPRLTGIGIMGYGPLDRVGGVGRLTFALDNSAANSAKALHYYSPDTAGCLFGWKTGLYVRLYFQYDGITKYAFYGKIDMDGIDVEPGYQGSRTVRVTCSNWMKEAESRSINMIAYQVNLTADQGLIQVVNNVPSAPLSTSFQSGTRVFPTLFDVTSKKTKAVSEINKLAMSEFGLIYLRGDHSTTATSGGSTLIFENRTYRYNNRTTPTSIPLHSTDTQSLLLLETGTDRLLLEDGTNRLMLDSSQLALFTESDIRNMNVSYGKHVYNHVVLTSYPRKVDAAAVVLWNLENPITLTPGQILSNIRSSYRDPNGKSNSVSGTNMITPVVTTDYTASSVKGSGSDKTGSLTISATFGTSEVQYTLTNTDTSTIYVNFLQFRGQGVYIYDAASVIFDSTASALLYGVSELSIDMPYVSDVTVLFVVSGNIDRLLLEDGTSRLLMENGNFMLTDDTAGVFDLLVGDEPTYWIDSVTFTANRNKFNMLAFMTLEAGSAVKLSETMTGVNGNYNYYINGYDLIIKGQIVEWSPVLVSALAFPKS
jgi:hypothetical protein